MDEDPLRRRIYFLTFVESLKMIFSQYIETCEVLLDYPKIGGDDIIEDYAKNATRNLLHANIDVTRPTNFELLIRPTEFSEENEKEHVPDDPDI